MEGLHDIEGLAAYGPRWSQVWPWLLATLLVAIFAVFVWKWWQRRRQSTDSKSSQSANPAEQLMTEFKKIKAVEPFDRAAQINFYYQLSLFLRQMMELRCHRPITDMTLKEIKAVYQDLRIPLNDAERIDVLKLLERSDMIKFADHSATLEEAHADHQKISKYLKQLRPRTADAPEVWGS